MDASPTALGFCPDRSMKVIPHWPFQGPDADGNFTSRSSASAAIQVHCTVAEPKAATPVGIDGLMLSGVGDSGLVSSTSIPGADVRASRLKAEMPGSIVK